MKTTNRLISLFAALLTATTMLADEPNFSKYEVLEVDSGFNRDVIKAVGSDTAISALYKTGSTSCFGTQSYIAQCNKAWETSDHDNYVRTVRSGWPDNYHDTIRCTLDGDAINNDKYKNVFWLLAPYNAPNALCLRPIETSGKIKGFQNDGTLKFKKIGSYQKLYFLVVSLRENSVADREITTTIYYTDGSSTSTKFTMVQGLKGEPGQRVCMTNVYEGTFNKNKVGATTTAFAEVFEITLDHTKLVNRIHFSNSVLNSSATILAVTGMTADMEVPKEEAATASNIQETSFEACWDYIADAASYRLDVAEDIDFQHLVAGYNNLNVGNTTCQEVAGLLADNDYYWRVRSVNAQGGQSASSAPMRVKTAGGEKPVTDEIHTDIAAELETLLNTAVSAIEIDRTLYRDGYYNTLCLPFNLSAEEIAASPLAGAQVFKFLHAEKIDDAQLDIVVEDTTGITAGVPYLIKWAPTTPEIINNGKLTFTNVVIRTNEGQTIGGENEVRFVGNIARAQMENGNHDNLFIGANNTLYWPNTDNKLKGFRAYFQVPTFGAYAVARNTPARIVTNTQITTSVEFLQTTDQSVQKIIRNGQIFIIRDGQCYDLLGNIAFPKR